MPWISERSATIPTDRLERLMADTADEARRRFGAAPKRVHSGAGRLTELL